MQTPNADLHNQVKATSAFDPKAVNSTQSGPIIDTDGFRSCEFAVQSGVVTDGTHPWTVTEGDASDLSDGTAVAAGNIRGALPSFASTDDNVCKRFGLSNSKRYVRLTNTPSGATTGGLFAASCILGSPLVKPVP